MRNFHWRVARARSSLKHKSGYSSIAKRSRTGQTGREGKSGLHAKGGNMDIPIRTVDEALIEDAGPSRDTQVRLSARSGSARRWRRGED